MLSFIAVLFTMSFLFENLLATLCFCVAFTLFITCSIYIGKHEEELESDLDELFEE